ncbi:sodium channel protein Nach-like isoform X2 [Epargyreus clarus]
MPQVAVCPAAEIVANAFLEQANVSISGKERLPPILGRVLRRKPATTEQLELLETILMEDNITLTQFLFKYTPTCRDIIRNCRWQTATIPCVELFSKEITQWGVCCIMRPKKIQIRPTSITKLEITRRLHLGMQCSNDSFLNGCEFYTKYEGEEWVEPESLTPGMNYIAQLTFVSVLDSDPDKLVDAKCSKRHSRSRCLLRCTEYFCGCSDPLRSKLPDEDPLVPSTLCTVTQLNCLRSFVDISKCQCLPPCKKISTYMALETSPISKLKYTHDNIYRGINATKGVSLNIRLRISGSRIFSVNPTETWITLLSSLGGVFNMFLGVGLFSALEFLFLIIVKLPIAIKRNNELEQPPITRH